MESEEFEQIPWSSLVAQQDDGIDKRIYLAIGVVAVLVIAVLGMRLVGGSPQPVPPQAAVVDTTPTPLVAEEPASTPPTSMIIAEADLRAEEPLAEASADRLTEVTAEWFVTDWFTRDGSEETIRSITATLAPGLLVDTLPHEAPETVAFVEWAKSVGSETTDEGVAVTVAYRVIRRTDSGFVREPVEMVVVTLSRDGDDVSVVALPES
jgi:hypothetical protein